MLSKTLLIFAVLCTAILIGCAKTDSTDNSNSTAGNSNKTGTTTTAPAGDKIGVAECDEFIAKYESCTSKVPEIARAQYKDAIARWRTEWKKLADNPDTKGTLAYLQASHGTAGIGVEGLRLRSVISRSSFAKTSGRPRFANGAHH